MQSQTVIVIGQGYVGLPLAQAAVDAGHTVIGFDTSPTKVAAIHNLESPIDDVDDTDLGRMFDTGRYGCYTDPEALAGLRFDVAIVTVPTPLTDGQPDLTAVLAAADTIGMTLRARPTGPPPLVVLESTVAPGTTRHAFTDQIEQASEGFGVGGFGRRFYVAFSPERIDPGNTRWTFRNTPKLVGGTTLAASAAATAFYRTICDEVYGVASAEIAESAKLLENTFRHVNIALVNELARHLRAMKIDPWAVIQAAATKPYGFMPFYPGPGVGGHCLPIDPQYLAEAVERTTGAGFDFVRLAMQVNRAQPAYVVQRITALLNENRRAVNGSTILVVGAAYKRNTGDLRETPAEEIIQTLTALGADVHIFEPYADRDALAAFAQFCSSGRPDRPGGHVFAHSEQDQLVKLLTEQPTTLFDMAVIITDHSGVPYEAIVRTVPQVLDTRGTLFSASTVTAL